MLISIPDDLVVHCAVMGPLGDETNNLIKYLVNVCPTSLETKSDHGYTPLFLACLLGRVEFAKTLIDAGADQSVKDGNYCNIVHATVTNQPKVEKLRELLNLLDPELRSHLFLQRNNLTHGGDTPVHSWLKGANLIPNEFHHWGWQRPSIESEDNVKLLELLVEFSGGHDLGILNGSGDTILHSAVARQLPGHMKVLLDSDPKLLYRENSVGRTPAEIAHDMFISHKVAQPEEIVVDHNPYQNETSYAHKGPADFVDWKRTRGQRTHSRKEQVWELAQEYLGKFPARRRLVSLNEANDVAKRLGESYSWQRYYAKGWNRNQDGEDDDAEKPEEEEEEVKESDFVTVQYNNKKGLAWH